MKFRGVKTTVQVATSFTKTVYDVRQGFCDFAISSITLTGYRSQCEYCPHPDVGQLQTNTNLCCLEFTEGYFRWGSKLHSLPHKCAHKMQSKCWPGDLCPSIRPRKGWEPFFVGGGGGGGEVPPCTHSCTCARVQCQERFAHLEYLIARW